MYNIPARIERFHMEEGHPTHLLLTKEQYDKLLVAGSYSVPMKHLYGLEVIFTDVPIDEPRILKL